MQHTSPQVITDIKACGELWNEFTPAVSLFDLWEFRKHWFDGFGYNPYFIYLNESPARRGLLPLWYNSDEKKYEWVGSYWPEDNTFFVSSVPVIPDLIGAAPGPLDLYAIEPFDGIEAALSPFGVLEQDADLKYVRPLATDGTLNQLLGSFSKKSRYNLKADYRRIMAAEPEIVWTDTTDPEAFNQYVHLKQIVFDGEQKESNFFDDPKYIRTFRSIIEHAKTYAVRTLQIKIRGELVGLDIVMRYNDRYYLIGGGYDSKRYSGIGNAALYLLFEDAINQRARLVDCLQEDSGWKHRYFEGRPLYTFTAS